MDYKKRYGIWGKGDKTEGRGKVNPQDGGKWCSQDDCCVNKHNFAETKAVLITNSRNAV